MLSKSIGIGSKIISMTGTSEKLAKSMFKNSNIDLTPTSALAIKEASTSVIPKEAFKAINQLAGKQ